MLTVLNNLVEKSHVSDQGPSGLNKTKSQNIFLTQNHNFNIFLLKAHAKYNF